MLSFMLLVFAYFSVFNRKSLAEIDVLTGPEKHMGSRQSKKKKNVILHTNANDLFTIK